MKEQIEAVQRMQDYIAAHLEERITLAALAGASLFSPWYSYRLFRQYTGLSPADYVRRLRLSRSALRLRDGADTVADMAFSLGFGSVDGYQRAFFRAFGCNPAEYAANPIPLGLFTPYGVKYRELRKETKPMEPVKTVFVHLVEKPARKAVIKRGMQANLAISEILRQAGTLCPARIPRCRACGRPQAATCRPAPPPGNAG